MAKLKTFHTLTGGQDSDTSSDYFKQDRLRSVVNMELVQDNNAIRLQKIRSTKEIFQWLPQPSDNLNVLAMVNVQANYVVSPTVTEQRESLLMFSYDDDNGSLINIIDIENTTVLQLYPNLTDNTDLNFPPRGTISASFTKENGVPEIYWDDNQNELRKLSLVIDPANLPTLRSMSVRRRLGVIATTNHAISVGGNLQGGSYQFFARLYNTKDGSRSKWSLSSNPIPIADFLQNNTVGKVFDQKISFRLDVVSSEIPFYDSYQLAVVKSIDGIAVPSTIAYITQPETDNYANVAAGLVSVEYKGDTGNEKDVPLEDVIGDDAGIEYAKTQAIKDNRLWRGNIKYFDYKNDRGEAVVSNAQTIKETVQYLTQLNTTNKKGHWRDEVYAYGLGYLDEFGNVGLVEPLDLSKFYKNERSGATTFVTAITPQLATYDQYTITVASATGIALWDTLEIGGVYVTVVEITGTTLLVKGDLSAVVAPIIAYRCIGKDGNHADNWAWKFPKRETPTYGILNASDLPQAIALRLTNITNYPSWAKAVIVVRQRRQKNILFQTPHIATIGARGVPSQPSNISTWSSTPLSTSELFDYRIIKDSDYLNQFDTLLPKTLGFGMAKNVPVAWLKFAVGLVNAFEYQPYYQLQDYNFQEWDGKEIPNFLIAPYPAWVYNFNGNPTISYELSGGEFLEACDAAIHTRIDLDDQTPFIDIANNYAARDAVNLYNNPQHYVLNGTDKIYLHPLFDVDANAFNNKINGQARIVLGNAAFLLTELPFSSPIFKDVNHFGYLAELSNNQGVSDKVPNLVRSFLNLYEAQRAVLLQSENKLIDFTYYLHAPNTGGFNYFPLYGFPIPPEIYDTTNLEEQTGLIPSTNSIDSNLGLTIPVNTIFMPVDEASGGVWILNVKKGLSDDRYSKTSADWLFTGAYAKLENNTNAPLSFDVWGGDCFLTLDAIKVNQNTVRISDKFDSVGGGIGSTNNRKVGSFVNNVEFLTMWLESEVNTFFGNRTDEYPINTGLGVQNYSKPYLKQYNGSYSIGNELKTYVSDEILTDNQRPQIYPARYVYSDIRIYQATDSAFFDTDGFSVFRPLSRRDLQEEFGGITGIVDFGDPTLHFIQERKVRVEPIGRDLIERNEGAEMILTDGSIVGRGGQYLPFTSGCQHMRTIKQYDGMAFFADQINRRVVMFASRGANWKFINEDQQISFFNTFLENEYLEPELFGIIDTNNIKQQYILVGNGKNSRANIYTIKSGVWESRLSTELFNAGVTVENILYAATKDLWAFYKGDIPQQLYGYMFGQKVNSIFSFIASPANAAYTTVFDSIVLNKEGDLVANVDSCIVRAYDKVTDTEKLTDSLAVTSYLYPTPIAPKNNRWWINRIRFDGERARATSYVVEFVIRNENRFAVYNVECNFTVSYRN